MHDFLEAYRRLLREHGTLGAYVAGVAGGDGFSAVKAICDRFGSCGEAAVVPKSAQSACKRVCMFLRWMVRDGSPVDLGLWADTIDRRTLVMPLDTHVVHQAMRLGLLSNATASMSAARRLTARLAEVFPDADDWRRIHPLSVIPKDRSWILLFPNEPRPEDGVITFDSCTFVKPSAEKNLSEKERFRRAIVVETADKVELRFNARLGLQALTGGLSPNNFERGQFFGQVTVRSVMDPDDPNDDFHLTTRNISFSLEQITTDSEVIAHYGNRQVEGVGLRVNINMPLQKRETPAPPDEDPLLIEYGRAVHMALQILEKRAEAYHVSGGRLRPCERLAELIVRRTGVERAALEEPPPLPGEFVAPGELPFVVSGALEPPDVPVDLPPHDPDREGSPHEKRVEEEVRHVLPVGGAAPSQVAFERAGHVPDRASRAVRLPPERPPVLLGVETEDRPVEPLEEPRRPLRERPPSLRRHGRVYAAPREISLYCLVHAAELYHNTPAK
jgi:hypothetical protein